jgi:hypothetical protein
MFTTELSFEGFAVVVVVIVVFLKAVSPSQRWWLDATVDM